MLQCRADAPQAQAQRLLEAMADYLCKRNEEPDNQRLHYDTIVAPVMRNVTAQMAADAAARLIPAE